MTRKKTKTHQSSNAVVNADSSDSTDLNNGKSMVGNSCGHMVKSVDPTQVVKCLKNGEDLKKNFCAICIKDKTPLKGKEIYVCLKCGTKTCCREHSRAHFDTPHSDLHAVAYDFTSQKVWCYGCSCEIIEKDVEVRKLSACISSVNRQLSSAQKEKMVNVKLPDNGIVGYKDNEKESFTRNQGNGKNGKKSGKSIVSQSALAQVPVKGLSNLGNTCYFNSVMQCLARTESLLSELKEMANKTDIRLELKGGETLKGCLVAWDQMSECLYDTLTNLLSPGSPYVPSKFLNFVRKKHPQFEGYDQHDAHELLRHTLDSIKMNDLKRYQRIMLDQKGLLKTNPKEVPPEVQKQLKEMEHKVTQAQTFIPEKTFKGKLVSRVECQECHHSSEYIEGFLDLSLPILADKPHPPVGRRKGGNPLDDLPQDGMERSGRRRERSDKQMRNFKKRQTASCSGNPEDAAPEGSVDEVAVEAHEALSGREEGLHGLDEEKPHESGYSSEKASSSLRGSPSSDEVRSSSPCDDSWSTLPQFSETWLSNFPDGFHVPVHLKEAQTNPKNRSSARISLLPDGSPNLALLSLHDSVGSTLNPLCKDTRSLIEQDPDWRSRIQNEPAWLQFSTSFESVNSGEEAKAKVDTSLLQSSGFDNMHDGSPATAVSTVNDDDEAIPSHNDVQRCDQGDSLVSPVRNIPPEVERSTCQTSEGLQGRSLSPPLRKIRIPHVKRDPDFSPLKEEDGDPSFDVDPASDSYPDVSGNTDSCSPKKETEAIPTEEVLISNGNVKAGRVEPEGDEEKTYFVSSCSTELETPVDPGSGEYCALQSSEFDQWSSFRESFKCPKEDGATLCGHIDGEDNPQTVHNNSLDSDGNDSGNEKLLDSRIGDFFPEEPAEDIPHMSPFPSPDTLVCNESHPATQQLSPEKIPSSGEEGDFEPLFGSLPNPPEIPLVREGEPKKDQPLKSNSDNLTSKDPVRDFCPMKRKDNRDYRDSSECTVESCLRQFTSIEFMTGSNKVGCSACSERHNKGSKDGKTVLTMATKQLLIGQAPPVLILHLKRFQVQLHSVRKLNKHVTFPLVLDLAPFCTSLGEDKNNPNNDMPMLYSLYAIVEHRGTLHSGHYVAYVKVQEADKTRWFCISDAHIDEVTEERVLKTEAYLLFYSKITHDPSAS